MRNQPMAWAAGAAGALAPTAGFDGFGSPLVVLEVPLRMAGLDDLAPEAEHEARHGAVAHPLAHQLQGKRVARRCHRGHRSRSTVHRLDADGDADVRRDLVAGAENAAV